MLELREVRVARGGTEVLRGVALAVQPGEVLAVIGPNGAGKSTLLHVLSGALRPDHGIAALDGVPLARLPRDELARRRAVLPQASVLSFPFRVREVVHLGRSPHRGRSTHGEDERAVEAAMRQAEVMHLADRIYTTLSGGERQRVHLARVLAQIGMPDREAGHVDTSRYLLLDEPTNALDLTHQHACLTTARAVARQGGGVVAVLHDPNLAAQYADRIVVVDRGKVTATGTPDDVLTEAVMAETYGLDVTVGRHPTRDCPHVYPA